MTAFQPCERCNRHVRVNEACGFCEREASGKGLATRGHLLAIASAAALALAACEDQKPAEAPASTTTAVITAAPTMMATAAPTLAPTVAPTATPTVAPTTTVAPTAKPSATGAASVPVRPMMMRYGMAPPRDSADPYKTGN